MCVAATSLLRDSYHHSSKLFSVLQFYSFNYFIYSIEVIVHWISVVVLNISVLLYSVCYSFCSIHKSRSMVLEQSSLHLFFFVHVLDKIWVQEVGTRTSRAFARSAMLSLTTTHGGREEMIMDKDILLKCFLRNPLRDKGTK
jgi:hypothetical protein